MTTWNPSDKSATISLTGSNLIATSSTGVSQSVRSTTSKASGKVFWEFTITTRTNDFAVGVANASATLNPSSQIGGAGSANSLGFYGVSPAQATYINGNDLNDGASFGAASSTNGAVVSIAFDITNSLIWITTAAMRAVSCPWNNVTSANPATGTGGQTTSTLAAGPYFAIFNDDLGGAVCTVNFGLSAFNQSIPSGFTAWDVAAAAGTPMVIWMD